MSDTFLGLDRSGNDNNFTVNNLTLAADQMVDSPTNNFATLNPINNQTAATLSEGNLKATGTASNWDNLGSTFAVSSGKWYWEARCDSIAEENAWGAGIRQTGWGEASQGIYVSGGEASAIGAWFLVLDDNDKATNGSGGSASFTSDIAAGDVVQFRLNLDANELSISVDGSDKGKLYDITADLEYSPALSLYNTSSATMNFGQDSSFAGTETAQGNQDSNGIGDFYYEPPTDYLALCTSNLDTPAVTPSEHFNTVLYTGTGSSNSITGVGFQPNLVWLKERGGTGANYVTNDIDGTVRHLQSNTTEAETTDAQLVSTYGTDGFTVGTSGGSNQSDMAMVAWNWKANGTGSANTVGDIDSTVSVNADAGFSIVSYTGNDGNGVTVGHGLTKAPELVIVKAREGVYLSGGWGVFGSVLSSTTSLRLESTAATVSAAGVTTNTLPAATVFTIADNYCADGSGHIAYCFHSVDGYSKVGSYTGNGESSDGTFVYTGFRPAYVMIKSSSFADIWGIYDNERSTYNVVDDFLMAHSNSAEQTDDTNVKLDFLSNGFKARGDNDAVNKSGGTLIYIAFAETPFKYSNAR